MGPHVELRQLAQSPVVLLGQDEEIYRHNRGIEPCFVEEFVAGAVEAATLVG
jgi:hypothetical protein